MVSLLGQVIAVHLALPLDVLQDSSQHPDDGDDQGPEGDGAQVVHGGIPHGRAQGAARQLLILVQGPVPQIFLPYIYFHVFFISYHWEKTPASTISPKAEKKKTPQ